MAVQALVLLPGGLLVSNQPGEGVGLLRFGRWRLAGDPSRPRPWLLGAKRLLLLQ